MGKQYAGKDYRHIKIPNQDLAMLSMRSVGWNIGTLREIVGGGVDTAKFAANLAKGKQAEFTHRMSDHVDGNKSNNDLSNLVPSCNGCNILRKRGWRIKDGELFVLDERGDRIRAVEVSCEHCGAKFLARDRKNKARRFC